jgi:hypothetical protein
VSLRQLMADFALQMSDVSLRRGSCRNVEVSFTNNTLIAPRVCAQRQVQSPTSGRRVIEGVFN